MRAIWVIVLLFLPAGVVSAGGPNILTPLTECPATHPACMLFDIYFKTPGTTIDDRPPYTVIISEDPDRYDKFDIPIVAEVRGRLNGGSEVVHRVAFPDGRGSEMVCQDTWAATVGVDSDGQGIILTDQGELKITDTTIRVGIRSSLKIIDGTSLEEFEHATPEWQSHFFRDKLAVSRDGRTYWRQTNICLDIDSGARFKQVSDKLCDGAQLHPARSETVEKVRRTGRYIDDHEAEYLWHYLWEIEGSNHIVYLYPIACT